MCESEIVVKKKFCSVTACKHCNLYELHIGPMSFRIDEDIFTELIEMFTDYLMSKPTELIQEDYKNQKH
jgi:hypothetical protein